MEYLQFLEGTEHSYDLIIEGSWSTATDSSTFKFDIPNNYTRNIIASLESDYNDNLSIEYDNGKIYLAGELFAYDNRDRNFDYSAKSDDFNYSNLVLGIISNIDGALTDSQNNPNIWNMLKGSKYYYHLFFNKGVRFFGIFTGDRNGINSDNESKLIITPAKNDDGTLGIYDIRAKKFYPIKDDVVINPNETIVTKYVLSPDEVSNFDNSYYDDVRQYTSQIDFTKVTSLEIPEGKVVKIQDSNDNVLWSKK